MMLYAMLPPLCHCHATTIMPLPCHANPCHVLLPCHAIMHYYAITTLCYYMLYYIMLCHIAICLAMPCHAFPRYMLCLKTYLTYRLTNSLVAVSLQGAIVTTKRVTIVMPESIVIKVQLAPVIFQILEPTLPIHFFIQAPCIIFLSQVVFSDRLRHLNSCCLHLMPWETPKSLQMCREENLGWQTDILPARIKWLACHLKERVHLLGFQLSERLPTSGIKPFTQVLRLWQLTSWSKQVSSSTGLNNLLPLIITWSGPGFYLKAIFLENTLNSSILFNMVSTRGYLLLNEPLPQKQQFHYRSCE